MRSRTRTWLLVPVVLVATGLPAGCRELSPWPAAGGVTGAPDDAGGAPAGDAGRPGDDRASPSPDTASPPRGGASTSPTPQASPPEAAGGDDAPGTRFHLYVATTGSDANPGTRSRPFRSILRASQAARADTTVHVAPGAYPGGFTTAASGTAAGRIRYVSDTKWGAKIVPAVGSTVTAAWQNRGDHVDIEGFEVDGRSGPVWRNGIATRGSHNVIRGNHVHHIADRVACDNNGGSAINTTSYYGGVHDDVVGNVVHHIGYAGCRFIQGIYLSTSGRVLNNLVYQIGKNGIQLWHDASHVTIANNTVFRAGIGIVVGGGDFYHGRINDYTHVSNNIVVDCAEGIREVGTTGTHNTYRNNLLSGNSLLNIHLKNGNTHTVTIEKDPQFVSYDPGGGGDYSLRGTSPAVDSGSPVHAPAVDLVGTARPQGGRVDIGAYERRAS